MDLSSTLNGWLALAALIGFVALSSIGFRALSNYAKDNIQNNAFAAIRKWAATYVAALAQDPYLKGLANGDKKQQADVWLVNKAAAFGITLTAQEAGLMVEEAVHLLKKVSLPNLAEDLAADPGA